ncbi:hypothetical protein ACH4E8_34480 [Streptomyces sp. NPDC017979]|uniref:hypothetical protein n=1 Tax=Streptomyces sp. NPDC017979 TaxID=3365024 RepID=UPI0037925978
MNTFSTPDGPASAYLRAVVAVLGPDTWDTSGFTWPERYVTAPEVALCIGLHGTHVLIWNPFAGGWSCDRIDAQGHMLDEAHQLIEGEAVPRPSTVMAAVRLQYLGRLDELPLPSYEPPVPAWVQLTPAQQRMVDRGALTEDVARRLAVYAEEERALART